MSELPILDVTKPVQTRDGRPARIICTDKKSPCGHSVVALVQSREGGETACIYPPSGRYNDRPGFEQINDLVNVTVKTQKFANVYKSGYVGYSCNSREAAYDLLRNTPLAGRLVLNLEDGAVVSVEFEKE